MKIGNGELNLRNPAKLYFNAGFFAPGKADLKPAPAACIRACDQAGLKSNAAWCEKDKLKGP